MVILATMLHFKAIYTEPGTTLANFGINHAPGAGSIAQPVDLQFSATNVLHLPPLDGLH